MTVTTRVLYSTAYLPAADTVLYPCPAATKTILDKVVAYNGDTASQLVSVNIVPAAGSVGGSNKLVSKNLAAGETYTFPEIVGNVLGAGEVLSAIAATANKVTIRVSGREVT